MVRAFHEHGIKVFVDVVYNHTAEGSGGLLLSLRGIDNAGYYQLDRKGTGFTNSNGVGADLAMNKPLPRALMLDSPPSPCSVGGSTDRHSAIRRALAIFVAK